MCDDDGAPFRLVALLKSSCIASSYTIACAFDELIQKYLPIDFVLNFDSSYHQTNLINLNKFQSEESSTERESLRHIALSLSLVKLNQATQHNQDDDISNAKHRMCFIM